MPRLPAVAGLLALGALVLVGCSDDESGPVGSAEVPEGAGDLDGSDPGGDGADPGAGGVDGAPTGDVAATVGSAEITVATVEELYDEISAAPQVAQEIEGEQGEVVRSILRAQILTQLVVQEILLQGAAEDHAVEITSEDLDAALRELADEVGGEEELDAQFEAMGLSRGAFVTLELPLTLALARLEEEFGGSGQPRVDGEMTEEQLALQSWGLEKLQAADVTVDGHYGTWNPEIGQVEPDGVPPVPPGDAPPPTG